MLNLCYQMLKKTPEFYGKILSETMQSDNGGKNVKIEQRDKTRRGEKQCFLYDLKTFVSERFTFNFAVVRIAVVVYNVSRE